MITDTQKCIGLWHRPLADVRQSWHRPPADELKDHWPAANATSLIDD